MLLSIVFTSMYLHVFVNFLSHIAQSHHPGCDFSIILTLYPATSNLVLLHGALHNAEVFVIDRTSGQKGCRGRACCQTLHSDQPGSWKRHGHALPQCQWSLALLQSAGVSVCTQQQHKQTVFPKAVTWDSSVLQ